ncbi:hypothetical protein VNO80_21270 [Phaseolus coccineus]|uniref:Uncharacterized protein n=1 Tax=Phaseolus coccineus TaxID=3886 RepID=A0AAN9M7J0_PHACN
MMLGVQITDERHLNSGAYHGRGVLIMKLLVETNPFQALTVDGNLDKNMMESDNGKQVSSKKLNFPYADPNSRDIIQMWHTGRVAASRKNNTKRVRVDISCARSVNFLLLVFSSREDIRRWLTLRIFNPLFVIMEREWLKRGLREMMPHALSSLAFLAVLATLVVMVGMGQKDAYVGDRLSLSVVFSLSSTPLSTVSSATGMIWKRFGIIPSIMSFVSPQRSIRHSGCSFTLCQWPYNCCRWPTKVGFKLLTQLLSLSLGG